MARLKIGAMIESFRLGVRPGIEKVAELGLDGFQLYVTGGEVAPENLSVSGRRDFRKFVERTGLEISALCVELGGYTDGASLDEKIVRTQRMLDLGVDLGVEIHTAHIGRVADDPGAPERQVLAEALAAIGQYAADRGRCFAAETGPEDAPLLRDFLASVGTDGLRVNFDPANLVMNGFDPVRGAYDLADLIVHTHAKDGVREEPEAEDPLLRELRERLGDAPEAAAAPPVKREVPLGQGQVPWPRYLAALHDIEYTGYLTIERETGDDPVADIVAAKSFLDQLAG
ncbi:sugar phosphate isomerase/epimerase [bacterium]|nr:sugar phosphate isomerase/epimerase [bacterium]